MEETEPKVAIISYHKKEEINWAEYLDYARNFEPAEINNISQDIFKRDFEPSK
ncbi:MAG: hypothetical protein ACXAEX_02185 [Promethearchaeota archaeon]